MKCDTCRYKDCFFRGGKCPKDNWDKEEELPDTITLKRIYATHCQVCSEPFSYANTHSMPSYRVVCFVPLDNNITCFRCAIESGLEYEPRIYKEDK